MKRYLQPTALRWWRAWSSLPLNQKRGTMASFLPLSRNPTERAADFLHHAQHRRRAGVPVGQERNRTIATLIRDGHTASAVRIFSCCATATGQTHFDETMMAYARSFTDKHLNRDSPPTAMTERLQCTALGHTNTCHPQKIHRNNFFSKRIIHSSIRTVPLSGSLTNGPECYFAAVRRHTFLRSSSIAFCSTSATTGPAS